MSDYCWCLATPAIEELIREHDELIELTALARAAYRCGDIEALVECCIAITTVLGPHIEVEERGLFPPMAVEFPEKIAILSGEHRRIEAVLAGATDGTANTDPAWPARVIDMLTLMRRHIVKEQEGLFPAALTVLTSDQWELLAELREGRNLIVS
ncbi:Hemerythrin-like domain-containing protein [Frankia sp. AiPs1]|uniref:hemerythrin domain-containing protein n=1 Tax=Frankia sp. AiPa1 TaxID=573492 RepID=UPI00202B630E|nr:hemerythrin domain-containing protein [Frankia sp. AiPa1]MCL9761187.1 hemerythrin domain-containing protein [Frankia sp. AiPa1]